MEWQEIQDNAVQRRSVPAEPTIVVAQEPSTQPSQPRARKPPLSLFPLLDLTELGLSKSVSHPLNSCFFAGNIELIHCRYVTSVGATQIKPNTAVTATAPEEACQTVIYSGGGFSNVFAIPSYQKSAVASYFSGHKPSYTATQYNNSQAVRGYPDVSANGANYVVAVDGTLSLVYGTSASAPTFGSVITLINEQRINANKSAVGFINPTVYANPSAFNDITSGGNEGCGTDGFTAVEGWDPVTGLGTPNYPKLLAAFMALS